MTALMSLMYALGFFLLKSFPLISALVGMHGCMYIFCGCTIAGALFVLFFLPETKGKSFDEIMKILEG